MVTLCKLLPRIKLKILLSKTPRLSCKATLNSSQVFTMKVYYAEAESSNLSLKEMTLSPYNPKVEQAAL